MKFNVHLTTSRSLVLVALLLATAPAFAALQPVAKLTLEYQQSERRWINDGAVLFGRYLGTGNGVANGALAGRIAWDLYEDQSRDDLHPALFQGFIERDGQRHAFRIIGVFTPDGSDEGRHVADETVQSRRWTLSGTIVFEDVQLLGVQHAPVTGNVDVSTGIGVHTVWVAP